MKPESESCQCVQQHGEHRGIRTHFEIWNHHQTTSEAHAEYLQNHFILRHAGPQLGGHDSEPNGIFISSCSWTLMVLLAMKPCQSDPAFLRDAAAGLFRCADEPGGLCGELKGYIDQLLLFDPNHGLLTMDCQLAHFSRDCKVRTEPVLSTVEWHT